MNRPSACSVIRLFLLSIALFWSAGLGCGPSDRPPDAPGRGAKADQAASSGTDADDADDVDDDFPVDPCVRVSVGGVSYDCIIDRDREASQAATYDLGRTVFADTHFELLDAQTPVRSQGSRGTCSIFSTVGYLEHLYVGAALADPDPDVVAQAHAWDFSEQALQWVTKVLHGQYRHSEGSSAATNLQAIMRYGIPDEAQWPYESSRWSSYSHPECDWDNKETMPLSCFTNGNPPAAAYGATKATVPETSWWQMTISADREAIMQSIVDKGTGVVVGVDFFFQAWSHGRSTIPSPKPLIALGSQSLTFKKAGVVARPNDTDVEESHTHRAGHSIVIVGWVKGAEGPQVPLIDEGGEGLVDDDGDPVYETDFFIFKNSWGTYGFGSSNYLAGRYPALAGKSLKGYGLISMKYIEDHGSAVAVGALPQGWASLPTPPPSAWQTAKLGEACRRYNGTPCEAGPYCSGSSYSQDGVCRTPGTCDETAHCTEAGNLGWRPEWYEASLATCLQGACHALLDVNQAPVEHLATLFGQAAAEAIVSHRDASGPFGSVDDLAAVVPAEVLDPLKPLLTV